MNINSHDSDEAIVYRQRFGLTVLTGDGAAWLPYREVLAGKFIRAMSAVCGENRHTPASRRSDLYASRRRRRAWQLVLPGNVPFGCR